MRVIAYSDELTDLDVSSVVIYSGDNPIAVYMETDGIVMGYVAGEKGFDQVMKQLGMRVDVSKYKLGGSNCEKIL